MKNLGSRWTVPNIPRTAAARSSQLFAGAIIVTGIKNARHISSGTKVKRAVWSNSNYSANNKGASASSSIVGSTTTTSIGALQQLNYYRLLLSVQQHETLLASPLIARQSESPSLQQTSVIFFSFLFFCTCS